MKATSAACLAALGALACAGCNVLDGSLTATSYTGSVRHNAVWAHDSSAVLFVETDYSAPSASTPYWSPDNDDYSTDIYVSENGLDDPHHIGGWSTRSDSIDGWIQNAEIYWHRAAGPAGEFGRLYYVSGNAGVVRDLDTMERTELSLPEEAESALFWEPLGINGSSEEIPARAIYPAPDGRTTAVLFTLGLLADEDTFELVFYHAVAFYDAELLFLAAQATGSAWTGTQFAVFRPEVSEVLPEDSEPVPGHVFPAYLLWDTDSHGVYLVSGELSDERALFVRRLPASEGYIGIESVTRVPERAIAAPGGAVSADGMMILRRIEPGDDNDVELYLQEVPGWVPFAENAVVPLAEADYFF